MGDPEKFPDGAIVGSAETGGKKGLKPERWALVPPAAKRWMIVEGLPPALKPFALAVIDFEEEGSQLRAALAGEEGVKLLLDLGFMRSLPVVYGKGAEKYKEHGGRLNFLLGYPFSWSVDALWRHLVEGATPDPETGIPAVVHAVWHALALNEFVSRGVGTNDLPYRKS